MLSREGARLQAFLELCRLYGRRTGPEELVIIDEQIRELPEGWVFPYTTRGYLAGDARFAVAGNVPLFIDRTSGEIRPWRE